MLVKQMSYFKMLTRFYRIIILGIAISSAALGSITASAQQLTVYRGAVQYPDFSGIDKAYAMYRTRIVNEMRTGPNFAGRFTIIEIGCGTGCRFVILADLSSGRLYGFPYGGEEYYTLSLTYGVKSASITAKWVSDDRCLADDLQWNGVRFTSLNKRVIGGSSRCNE